MRLSTVSEMIGGKWLDVRFRAGPAYAVEIAERPSRSLPPARLEKLRDDCSQVVAACLDGRELDYGLFDPAGDTWDRTVVTLVRRLNDGRPIAFNAMPLLAVRQDGHDSDLLHLGLVMVDPAERSGGLSWILYGLTCFALFVRGRLRPLWVSSVTQVPAVVGMVAETFDQVYPGQEGTKPTFVHRHLAHQLMARHRATSKDRDGREAVASAAATDLRAHEFVHGQSGQLIEVGELRRSTSVQVCDVAQHERQACSAAPQPD